MYRGSGFLLQHAYTIHRPVVDLILDARFKDLGDPDFGASERDQAFIPLVLQLADQIRNAYLPFAASKGAGIPTDTLISKVILGAYGCMPACDRYFLAGFKREGLRGSRLNRLLVEQLHAFCRAHIGSLHTERQRIERLATVRYPLMKLVDMYFWQVGYTLEDGRGGNNDAFRLPDERSRRS